MTVMHIVVYLYNSKLWLMHIGYHVTRPLAVAQDDLEKVTKMAYKQVVEFGMSPAIGHVSFPLKRPEEFGRKPYSKQLSKMIDEVRS